VTTTTIGRTDPDNWVWRVGRVDGGPAVVFDIDGVLSDAAGRQHFIEGGGGRRKDWDAFFEACGDDPLIDEVGRLLELLDDDLRIILLTGRPVRVQPQTLAWLDHWDVMRDWGDYSAAREFKRWCISDFRRAGFDLRLSFEDDPRNVEMFRSEGVPCVYIHSGYFG
jgi:phosphoglycolate phosphatase-like HAD superfamily hydrolase